MEFCRVDRAAWPRNEYFEHYFSNTPCTYSMTVKLDVTNIEEKGLKYYPALLYALTTVVNRHEEFRTALDAEGQVGIFSAIPYSTRRPKPSPICGPNIPPITPRSAPGSRRICASTGTRGE